MARHKIALIGGPASGKTETAEAIEERLIKDDGSCIECKTPIQIIDDYADDVGKRHDYAVGLDGGWLSSVAIAMERYGRERKALGEARTIITCGTLLESSVYMTMYFERMSRGMSQPDLEDAMVRMESGMRFFASLYVDSFHYNRAFYLPPIYPVEDERMATFDKNIQAAFNAFNLTPVEPLMIEADSPKEIITERVSRIMAPREDTNEIDLERAADTPSPSP